jgi:hypothetical protein
MSVVGVAERVGEAAGTIGTAARGTAKVGRGPLPLNGSGLTATGTLRRGAVSAVVDRVGSVVVVIAG